MSEAAVFHSSNSESFESAKQRVTLLEQLDYWSDELSAQAQSAIDENNQISDAWEVPHRLRQLIYEKSGP